MPPPKPPPKHRFTSKLTHPHDIYKGNTDHWSVMRFKADTYVTKERLKQQEKKGRLDTVEPYSGCSSAPYVWSREGANVLRAGKPFSELVEEGLWGELPGDLSKDQHKLYNRRAIDWPMTHWRKHAKENKRYWFFSDLTFQLSLRPRKDRNKLAI